MAKPINEGTRILKVLPSQLILELDEFYRNEKFRSCVFKLLELLATREKDIIFRNAGAANSMDDLVKLELDQSFHKGRVSLAVLVSSIINQVESEAEIRDKKSDE